MRSNPLQQPEPILGEEYTTKNMRWVARRIKAARIKEQERIKKLITDEIAIAHKEGTPTARLTSIYMKLEEPK